MEDPTGNGGVSGFQSGRLKNSDDTRKTHNPQAAARAIEAGLICLPDAWDMAFILRRHVGLPERIWLSASALISLPADNAEQLAEATRLDLITYHNGPVAAEAERQRRRWMNYCASKTPSEQHRGGGR